MKNKKTLHSAKSGKFVSKEFAKENPDTTVEITNKGQMNIDKAELELWLNNQIEKCQELDMPREEWAYIQVLNKINTREIIPEDYPEDNGAHSYTEGSNMPIN